MLQWLHGKQQQQLRSGNGAQGGTGRQSASPKRGKDGAEKKGKLAQFPHIVNCHRKIYFLRRNIQLKSR